MLESVFLTVLKMTLEGAVAITVVLLLRLALKRAPKIYSYGLWLLVLVRLLCPVFPELSVSPMPDFGAAAVQLASYTSQTAANEPEKEIPAPGWTLHQDAQTELTAETREAISLETVLSGVWLAGATGMLIWGAASMISLGRKLRTAVPAGEGVYLADHAETAFVVGLIKPRIYLPSDVSQEWVEGILRHERYHIRRKHHWVKLAYFAALALHWLNPLVWVAYWLMARDMEMSCDEAVMKEMDSSTRKEYAQSLLNLAAGHRSFPAPLAFGETDTKQRIRNILNFRKPALWATVGAAAVCTLAVFCLLTNPVQTRSDHPEVLEFPGIPWLSGPEEVKAVLGITQEDILSEYSRTEPREGVAESNGEYQFRVGGLDAFGETCQSAVFIFQHDSDTMDDLQLVCIEIYFPDGYGGDETDLDRLKSVLDRTYGPSATEKISRDWVTIVDSIQEEKRTIEPGFPAYWYSQSTVADILSDEEIRALYDLAVSNASQNREPNWIPTVEEYSTTLTDDYLVSMSLRNTFSPFPSADTQLDDLTEELREYGNTNYVLVINAAQWYAIENIRSQLRE